MRFQGKTVIVTGGAQGIGLAIAQRFAGEGASVVINDIQDEKGLSAAAAIVDGGGRASYLRADVTNPTDVASLIEATLGTYERIDILVNNVGLTRDGLLMKMDEKDWDLVLGVNLKSVYLVSRAAIRPMMRQRAGRIVNISSVAGLAGNAGQTNYAASKAGIVGFTKSLAKEVGPRGITVNAVAPGYIPTDLTSELPKELVDEAVRLTPLGRLGTVDDVAGAVTFLASEDARFITGQVIRVDGGMIF
jgi:3-oxoacyl-[acyl-carrier protein] reductase